MLPEDYDVHVPFTDIKGSALYYPRNVTESFGYCLIFLALSSLPILWREITNRALKPYQGKVPFVKPLLVYETIFAVSIILAASLGNSSFASIVAFPFVIILIFSYGFYGIALSRVLVSISSTQDTHRGRFLKSARVVAKTSLIIFAFGSIFCIDSLVFFFLTEGSRWREYATPYQVARPLILATTGSFIILCGAVLCQYFIGKETRGKETQTTISNEAMLEIDQGGDYRPEKTVAESSVANPDSIVNLNDIRSIKSKKKVMAKNAKKLKPINDVTVESSSGW